MAKQKEENTKTEPIRIEETRGTAKEIPCEFNFAERMTKQKKIREGLITRLDLNLAGCLHKVDRVDLETIVDKSILPYLHSQRCRIEVDRDLVNTDSATEHIKSIFLKWLISYADNKTTLLEVMRGIREAGYEAVEPLIKE